MMATMKQDPSLGALPPGQGSRRPEKGSTPQEEAAFYRQQFRNLERTNETLRSRINELVPHMQGMHQRLAAIERQDQLALEQANAPKEKPTPPRPAPSAETRPLDALKASLLDELLPAIEEKLRPLGEQVGSLGQRVHDYGAYDAQRTALTMRQQEINRANEDPRYQKVREAFVANLKANPMVPDAEAAFAQFEAQMGPAKILESWGPVVDEGGGGEGEEIAKSNGTSPWQGQESGDEVRIPNSGGRAPQVRPTRTWAQEAATLDDHSWLKAMEEIGLNSSDGGHGAIDELMKDSLGQGEGRQPDGVKIISYGE